MIEIFYYFSLFCVKTSILSLYLRMAVDLRTSLWWASTVTMTIIVLHFVSTIVVVGVQCVPMEKYWIPETEGHCINITGFFFCINSTCPSTMMRI